MSCVLNPRRASLQFRRGRCAERAGRTDANKVGRERDHRRARVHDADGQSVRTGGGAPAALRDTTGAPPHDLSLPKGSCGIPERRPSLSRPPTCACGLADITSSFVRASDARVHARTAKECPPLCDIVVSARTDCRSLHKATPTVSPCEVTRNRAVLDSERSPSPSWRTSALETMPPTARGSIVATDSTLTRTVEDTHDVARSWRRPRVCGWGIVPARTLPRGFAR